MMLPANNYQNRPMSRAVIWKSKVARFWDTVYLCVVEFLLSTCCFCCC